MLATTNQNKWFKQYKKEKATLTWIKYFEPTQSLEENNIIISKRTKKNTSFIVNENLLKDTQHGITSAGNESTDKQIM